MIPGASALTIDLLNTDPAPVRAGEYADVTLRFVKDPEDTMAREVAFKIMDTDYIIPVSETELFVTSFKSGDTITHTFRVFFSDNLPEGYVDLQVEVEFAGGAIIEDLPIFVQEEQSDPELFVGQIRTVPDELLPDTDRNKLYVTLQNLGDKDAELVHATLSFENNDVKPSFSYSVEDSVARVRAGNETELEFTVDLEEGARNAIPASLNLRYRVERDTGNTYDTVENMIPFILPVSEAPFLKIMNVTYLDEFVAGTTENRVRVTIMNDGEEEAEEVRVRVLPDISYPFIFELTTEYVASKIKPGETAEVEFKAEVVSSAVEKEYPITVRLESLVGETRYNQDDTITLIAMEKQGLETGQIGVVIIVVAFAFAIYLGYHAWKGRKK